MLKYLIYCRKSSEEDDRQVLSNESQRAELEPIVKRERLTVSGRIEEAASAKTAGTRPLFNKMLNGIRNDEANAVLCWHPNRLSRNATDAARLVDLMDEAKLQEIRTPSQVFKNTPGDKFLLTLFCSQAKLENDNKGVDVKRGLRAKVEMGWYPGVAPAGYLNDKTKNRGERDLLNDPERFPLIKRIWRLMLTGNYTTSHILEIANEWGFRTRRTKKQGGNPLKVTTLYHILHNPFYYGWFEYPKGSGKWHQGKHEPMVSQAEFDRVQVLLGRTDNPRPITHFNFAFTGRIRCGECGGMITAEEKRQVICSSCRFKFSYRGRERCPRCETMVSRMPNSLFLHYTYYHCSKRSRGNCKQPSLRVDELESQIQEQLGRIQISKQFKDWALTYVRELHREELDSLRHAAESKEKAYRDCLKRLENLLKLKTSPENADGSLLSDEEYGKQRRELLQEKAGYERSPDEVRRSLDRALSEAESVFDFAQNACHRFAEGDSQVKREILSAIVSNLILKNKKLIIEAKKPFTLLGGSTSPGGEEAGPFEPQNPLLKQGPNARTRHSISRQLGGLCDVRTLEHRKRILVKRIYHFFRSACSSPSFNLYDWYALGHAHSMENWKN